MDFWVILYSLICTIVGGGAVAFLYKREQPIGAMLLLVLLILIFIFYGLRWFPKGILNGTGPSSQSWPPIVNMCPDFMVSWTNGNQVYCYDSNNVYGLKTATASGPLRTGLTINGINSQSAYLIKNPGGSATAPKSIEADSASAPYFPLAKTLTDTSSTVLTPAMGKLLRWEGVWDGQTLTAAKIPLPA